MSVTIGSNLAAVRATRQLARSTSALTQSFERLSSGLRINRASDDAAGLAIASSLKKDARVYGQALRNGNDAISALSIGEGALGQAVNVITRLKELAVQAANGSFSRVQRLSIDREGLALTNEFNRLLSSTTFNGMKLLDGSLGQLDIQLGYGVRGSIGFGLGKALSRTVGSPDSYYEAENGIGTDNQNNAIAVADFNGDGILDYAVGNNSVPGVEVFLNTDREGTTSNGGFFAGSNVIGIVTGDFNGDGYQDIAANTATTLTIAYGDGTGNFTPTTTGGLASGAIVAGDLNGDGRQDLVFNAGGQSRVYIGSSAGLTLNNQFAISGGAYPQMSLYDMNGDGSLDMVSNASGGRIQIHHGNGNGTFGGPIFTSYSGSDSFAVGDFNMDGLGDIATLQQGNNYIDIYSGTSSGVMTLTARLASFGGAQLDCLQTGDVNGDGKTDIVALSGGLDGLWILDGNGAGGFAAARQIVNGWFFQTSYSGSERPIIADIDNDGAMDISFVGNRAAVAAIFFDPVTTNAIPRLNFTTPKTARDSLSMLDSIFERVQKELGQIGANQSRILSALAAIRATRENSEAAAGRIFDADIAGESSLQVRNQILQQAGAAVLAQASQAPSLALQLLQ